MLKVSLEQWRMFKAVADFGGFNQAAKEVHKSQSSIHTAVNKIEHTLGSKLFNILGRKTELTETGELILRKVEYLLSEAEKVESIAYSLAGGVESGLSIAVDEIFPPYLLYRVLDKVSSEFPHLRISIKEAILNGPKELLANAEVDIAISSVPGNQLFTEELDPIEFVAVASPNHYLNQIEATLTTENLKSHRQIVVRDSAIFKQQDEGWLEADQRWTVSHIRTSIDMIKKGFGFAWLPVPLIADELKIGQLKTLNLKSGARRKVQLYLLFNDGSCLGPAARAFLGHLRYQTM